MREENLCTRLLEYVGNSSDLAGESCLPNGVNWMARLGTAILTRQTTACRLLGCFGAIDPKAPRLLTDAGTTGPRRHATGEPAVPPGGMGPRAYTRASAVSAISSAPARSKISLARDRSGRFSACTEISMLPSLI